jgi:hypothetical protein
MKILKSLLLVIVVAFVMENVKAAYALTDESTLNIYHCGTLHSSVWKQWPGKSTGNSCKWNYLVSAKIVFNKKYKHTLRSICTEWYASAYLCKSATLSLGVSDSSVSAGSSRTYVYRRTKVRSWTNTKSHTSSYRSNVVVSPENYYKDNTMAIHNKAKVKICGDKRVFEINAVA